MAARTAVAALSRSAACTAATQLSHDGGVSGPTPISVAYSGDQ
jgi:hypothetical protein